MRIFFCGTYVPEHIEHRENAISAAGNRFQHNLVENLRECGNKLSFLSYIGMDVGEDTRQELTELNGENGGNRYILRRGNMLRCFMKYNKEMRKGVAESDWAVCYNLVHMWFLLPYICRSKKKKSILVLADYSGSESYKSLPRKIYAKIQLLCIRRFDCVIGLSENTRRFLKPRQKFFLMMGGIDQDFYDFFSYIDREKEKEICILYAGLLSEVTGVDMLLEAFRNCKRLDLHLVITGKGPMEQQVLQAAKRDGRIKAKLNLEYQEYMEELKAADILVNPRNMRLPENQNNFPSKIMDYLASGKIIVSTKFIGWEKFKENILFCDCSIEGIERGLEEAVSYRDNAKAVYCTNREKAKSFEWKRQLKNIFRE